MPYNFQYFVYSFCLQSNIFIFKCLKSDAIPISRASQKNRKNQKASIGVHQACTLLLLQAYAHEWFRQDMCHQGSYSTLRDRIHLLLKNTKALGDYAKLQTYTQYTRLRHRPIDRGVRSICMRQ